MHVSSPSLRGQPSPTESPSNSRTQTALGDEPNCCIAYWPNHAFNSLVGCAAGIGIYGIAENNLYAKSIGLAAMLAGVVLANYKLYSYRLVAIGRDFDRREKKLQAVVNDEKKVILQIDNTEKKFDDDVANLKNVETKLGEVSGIFQQDQQALGKIGEVLATKETAVAKDNVDLQQEIAQLKTTVKQLEDSLKEAAQKYQLLKASNDQLTRNNQKLEQTGHSLDKSLDKMGTQVSRELLALNRNLQTTEQIKESLVQTIGAQSQALQTEKEAIQALAKESQEERDDLAHREQLLKQFQQELDQTVQRFEAIKTELALLSEKHRLELMALQKQSEQIKTASKELDEKIAIAEQKEQLAKRLDVLLQQMPRPSETPATH